MLVDNLIENLISDDFADYFEIFRDKLPLLAIPTSEEGSRVYFLGANGFEKGLFRNLSESGDYFTCDLRQLDPGHTGYAQLLRIAFHSLEEFS